MKMINLENLRDSLLYNRYEVKVPDEIKAERWDTDRTNVESSLISILLLNQCDKMTNTIYEKYMKFVSTWQKGLGCVSPNPLVGCNN